MITLKRVYDHDHPNSGARFLVERLWPRGIRKEALAGVEWRKEVAPSPELRTWFSHDPAKWSEFRRRYFAELDAHPEAWQPLRDAAAHGPVTLFYSSHDQEHNNAVALRDFLEAKLHRRQPQ